MATHQPGNLKWSQTVMLALGRSFRNRLTLAKTPELQTNDNRNRVHHACNTFESFQNHLTSSSMGKLAFRRPVTGAQKLGTAGLTAWIGKNCHSLKWLQNISSICNNQVPIKISGANVNQCDLDLHFHSRPQRKRCNISSLNRVALYFGEDIEY